MNKPNHIHGCKDYISLGTDVLDDRGEVYVYACLENDVPAILLWFKDEPERYITWSFILMRRPSMWKDVTSFQVAYKYYSKAQLELTLKHNSPIA